MGGRRRHKKKLRKLYPNCDMNIWLRSCLKEETAPVEGTVHGQIPPWLEGCLLRNGPGNLKVGNSKFLHLFDCSALLHRFCIRNGTVTYQNRFLKSESYKRNLAAQRIVISEFGTKAVPDPCQTIFQRVSSVFERFKTKSDNAMISIYPFGDEYFAMTETPIVHRINVSDLSTEERIDISKVHGIICHTSHPHLPEINKIYNLGLILSPTGPKYCIIEFLKNEDETKSIFHSGKIVCSVPSKWKFHPSYMHTFGLTNKYYVIVEQPLNISLYEVIKNSIFNRALVEALKWYSEEMTVFYVIDKTTGSVFRTFVAQAFFYLHIINQYEDGDYLVIDICCYKDPSMINCMYIKALEEAQQNMDYANMFRGRPLRFVLPLFPQTNEMNSENLNKLSYSKSEAIRLPNGQILIKPDLLCDLGCETPKINYEQFVGRKYRYFYAISSDVDSENPGTLIKVDVKKKTRNLWWEKNVYPSEPIFVPKPDCQDEDDGVILSALLWGGKMSNQVGLLILDAKTWKEVGRAVFTTSGPVPKCLHGWFIKNKC